jgi:hypothetical protein
MKTTKRLSRQGKAGIHNQPMAQKSGKVICSPAESELSAAGLEQRYKFVGPVTDKPIFVSETRESAA